MKKAYNTHEKKTREIQVSRQFFDLISSNTTDSLISPDQIFAVTAEFLSQLADTGITPEAALRKIFPYAKPVPWLAKPNWTDLLSTIYLTIRELDIKKVGIKT